jgi:Cys-tRNA(Pro) deacylase
VIRGDAIILGHFGLIMGNTKTAVTRAVRSLKESGASFVLRPYPYTEKGGTGSASRALGVDEHRVVKTLVMEDDAGRPLVVLMHGDRSVSTRGLARILGVQTVRPCDPETAHRHTGYTTGGISPFGMRKPLPIYLEASILGLDRILINAGRRGLLAEISPDELSRILSPTPVSVAVEAV